MRIVADENMPLVEALFGTLGEVVRLPGRSMTSADVRDADALLVRSVTRVTRELLEGSRVRFVGTATIGTDHIDLPAMAALGVAVVSAPGCNARAVAEYVLTCLALLAEEQGWQPSGRSVGVVGLGNVGRHVVSLLQAAGFRVAGCDPFVDEEAMPGLPRMSLDDMIEHCDILLLHTPLTRSGPHPTFHLLDEKRLARLRSGQILLNAGRGEVVDNAALRERLQAGNAPVVVLDVWEGEPRVMPILLERVRLGSPHVAGYSQEGKWRGTAMVYEAWCRFAGISGAIDLDGLSLPAGPVLSCPQTGSLMAVLAQLSGRLCAIERDDAALRASLADADPEQAFDRLRRTYPPRFEFASCTIKGPIPAGLLPGLQGLGFRISED
jgi:erythronate-4-phosphate dehydrogenase